VSLYQSPRYLSAAAAAAADASQVRNLPQRYGIFCKAAVQFSSQTRCDLW
jgi:hypothetical protein